MLYDSTLRTLLASVDEGIHVVDRQGVTVLYNAQAGVNDGLEPHEVVGKHILEVFPSLTEGSSTLLKVLSTETPIVNQQQTFTNYKGVRITTVNSTWPIYDSGQLIGAMEISKDVTRVRELSEQVADLQAELLGRRRRRAMPHASARYSIDDLIGRHPSLEALKQQALRAARGKSPVLIYGETGTGKELLVHAIHHASQRHSGPLVAQNCAALPEGLLEGILFGTVKGGFTGAEDRPGLFELGDGGTLYLDEINSMPLELQAKLLRVLQDGRVRRVGDLSERAVDVRVIASSNEEPEVAVRNHRLRQDLYYRINVVCLELPPLRDRRTDIPQLVAFFFRKHGAAALGVHGLSTPLEHFFQAYSWPGNVRELEHVIEAGLHMAHGDRLLLEDLPAHLQRAARAIPGVETGLAAESGAATTAPAPTLAPVVNPREMRDSLTAAERAAVQAAVEQCGWNLSRAAKLLGIPRQTLQYRIKVLDLKRPEPGVVSG